MRIDYDDAEGELLLTSIAGRSKAWSTRALLAAFVQNFLTGGRDIASAFAAYAAAVRDGSFPQPEHGFD